MDETPKVSRVVESVAGDLDAHVRSLRRKLERAAERGQPVERLLARIRREEEQLLRLRAHAQRQGETRRTE
jgi:hypothetical protein